MTGRPQPSSDNWTDSVGRGSGGSRIRGGTVVIERRFRGPLDSGHGGYTCGLLARRIPGPAEVSLRVPPPLERQLALERIGDGRVLLRDGEVVVADARPAALELYPPAPIALRHRCSASSETCRFMSRCICSRCGTP
jgi:hypothetical protein